MKKRRILVIGIVLIVIVAALAAVHLFTRENVPEGSISVTLKGEIRYVPLSDLDKGTVTGVRMNGKGEEIPVNAPGTSVHELLSALGAGEYSAVTVVSDDSYSAEVTFDEAEDSAYLILEDGQARLVVFGDENSKRSVSNVKQITVS